MPRLRYMRWHGCRSRPSRGGAPANRHKHASGACNRRASAVIEAVVRAGRRCWSQGGDDAGSRAARIAQKEASGSRPATGLRWPRGARRRDKRRLWLSRSPSYLDAAAAASSDFCFGSTGTPSISAGSMAAGATNQQSRPRSGGGWWRSLQRSVGGCRASCRCRRWEQKHSPCCSLNGRPRAEVIIRSRFIIGSGRK